MKIIFIILLILSIPVIGIVVLFKSPQLGVRPKGNSLKRIHSSGNYKNNKFVNLLKTPMRNKEVSMRKTISDFIKGGDGRVPVNKIQAVIFNYNDFNAIQNGISLVWFGHSTVLLNIDGYILLTDPMFSKKASPFPFMGVKSFNYSNQYTVEDFPEIDMILISHDHYDHLDLNGKMMLPLHWGKFNVSLHSWTEPMERLFKYAEKKNIIVTTPTIGTVFKVEDKIEENKWWEKSN